MTRREITGWSFPGGSGFSRRRFLNSAAAGLSAGPLSGWLEPLAVRAGEALPEGRPPKACIVLFMSGGPAHIDTFDMKPDAAADIRGPFTPIETSVPGIRISENFSRFAPLMRHAAIIRSMTTSAGAHADARYHVHTGKLRGGLEYPAIGAIVAKELGRPDFALPNYVSLGPFATSSNDLYNFFGPGFLGPQYQPLVIKDPERGVENLKASSGFERRLGLLEEMQQGFYQTRPVEIVASQRTSLARSVRLMQAKELTALDLSQEPQAIRMKYGKHPFGESCLLARRLVETGVPFVEVGLGGWDTHGFTRDPLGNIRDRSQLCDQAMTALVEDLRDRGRLDETLIVWMGEFGRSPKRSDNGGTSHWPQAWTTMLVGGGIRGGQVIGRTDSTGGAVEERPVPIQDFLATICRVLGIDDTKTNQVGSRPVPIVDHPVVRPIGELFDARPLPDPA